jgi:rhamnose utilization protein RhaD (predicted bifunctional aldolase and dehydrogenase)
MQNLVNENLSKLSAISVALGSNPRLIQGAGGNTSFKTEENLWIKASGMWLSEAANNNIFVKLDLSVLREQILSDEVNPVKSAFSPDHIQTLVHRMQ